MLPFRRIGRWDKLLRLMSDQSQPIPDGAAMRRAGIRVTILFWTVQLVQLTLSDWLADPARAKAALMPRAAIVTIGMLLTLGLVRMTTKRACGAPFARRVRHCAVTVLVASALAGFADQAFSTGSTRAGGIWIDPAQLIRHFFSWSWFFAAIAAAMLATSYCAAVRDRERRLADAQSIAQSAQLRALRYQLNPHFLFNTLNSVAALIGSRKPERAEEMVENLSDFLRTSLELDPYSDIGLTEELELQSLYLNIEAVRFPGRLKVETDVPPALRDALVPSLLTQPLIENAVKYGVARTRRKITLSIRARAEAESLCLQIINSGIGAPSGSRAGTGIGIANVEARLRARFGSNQKLSAGFTSDGDYAVNIRIPLRYSKRPDDNRAGSRALEIQSA